MSKYFLRTKPYGKIQGPFSGKQIKALADKGKLNPDYLISQDQSKWVSVSKVKFAKPSQPVAAADSQAEKKVEFGAVSSRKQCTQLHQAIKNGDFKTVQALLENNPQIVNMKEKGSLPLHTALSLSVDNPNHLKILKRLLPEGNDINSSNANGHTPLHLNSMTGNKLMAEILISAGADVNIHNPNDGLTPLHLATLQNKNELVVFLVKNMADINARDWKSGNTPLHFAAIQGHASTLKFLLYRGADLSLQNNDGQTALELAQKQNRIESVQALKHYMESNVSKYQEVCYFECTRPPKDGKCSDDSCPCGFPGANIPRGNGYLYISEELVEMRRDALSLSDIQLKIEGIGQTLGFTMTTVTGGVIMPILMCELGARKRGIDLTVAAADARHWWKTGLAPLRPTPMTNSSSNSECVMEKNKDGFAQEETVEAVHKYAALLMQNGLSSDEVESRLVEQGLNRESANAAVKNSNDALKSGENSGGGGMGCLGICILIGINILSYIFDWSFWIY